MIHFEAKKKGEIHRVRLSDSDKDLSEVTWSIDKEGYLFRKVYVHGPLALCDHLHGRKAPRAMQQLHREIARRVHGYSWLGVDHKDRDTFNNTRENLRYATRSTNSSNRGLSKRSISGVNGVCYSAREQAYKAVVKFQSKTYFLGYFCKLSEAQVAVIRKCWELGKPIAI
jgi:HNH endonuclease